MKKLVRAAAIATLFGLTLASNTATASATNAQVGLYPSRQACIDAGTAMFPGQYGEWYCLPAGVDDGNYRPDQPHGLWRGPLRS
ncbi:hypothetical protein CEQ30_33450 [Nocardia brasiliensis]|nr:hypothetical protein CEQ30_33450 [Nocardia brasiliensis]